MGPLSLVPLPYRIIVIALLALALFGYGWFRGNEYGTAKLADYIGKQAVEAVRIVTKQGVVNTQVVTKYVKVAGETKIVTEAVEKEVIKYAEANPGYCLDARWRRLHDAAATNTVPDAAGATDGTVRAPRAAEALDTVTANYAACNSAEDRLDALQAWVRQQAAVR